MQEQEQEPEPEPECHKVEWTRISIGERSWRVKLEYG